MKIGKSYGKVLIVSSWKMGSTLLTDLLGSHPLAFVLYEPLWHFGIERLRNKNSTKYKEQLGLIRDLLNCNFSSFRRKLFQKNIEYHGQHRIIIMKMFANNLDSWTYR